LVLYNEQNKPIGCAILLLKDGSDRVELSYIFIKEDSRNKGYGNDLFNASFDWACKLKKDLTLRIQDINSCKEILLHMLEKRNANPIDTSYVYQHYINEETKRQWQTVLDKNFVRIKNFLEAQGFDCTSFEKSDSKILEEIYFEKKFDDRYDPNEIFQGNFGPFLPSYSFVSSKNGKSAALIMAIESDKESVVSQLISVTEKYKKSGAVLLCIIKFMGKAFDSKYKKIGYCVSSNNSQMLRVVGDTFQKIKYIKIKQSRYLIKHL
jgi:hypothetical protein